MSWIEVINTVVLFVTAVIIAWYTVETYKLRRETVRQNEINLRPYLVPSFPETREGYKLEVKNIGNGTATNIRINIPPMNFTDVQVQWKYEVTPLDWLESGSSIEAKLWHNGQLSMMNILLVPQANRFQLIEADGPRQMGVPWVLRLLFDDVEGARYLLEFDITPTERPESKHNVLSNCA
jgi:hypothetical protein